MPRGVPLFLPTFIAYLLRSGLTDRYDATAQYSTVLTKALNFLCIRRKLSQIFLNLKFWLSSSFASSPPLLFGSLHCPPIWTLFALSPLLRFRWFPLVIQRRVQFGSRAGKNNNVRIGRKGKQLLLPGDFESLEWSANHNWCSECRSCWSSGPPIVFRSAFWLHVPWIADVRWSVSMKFGEKNSFSLF